MEYEQETIPKSFWMVPYSMTLNDPYKPYFKVIFTLTISETVQDTVTMKY